MVNKTDLYSSASYTKSNVNIKNIQYLIWLYFWLLIFEGSLRKWVVPQLSAPLLIIRDPVVIGAYFLAIKGGVFPNNVFTKLIIYIAFISFLGGLATVILSNGSLSVAIFGLRTNFLHLPLIFLISNVFKFDDVTKLGKWVLLLALPMAFLMVYQFNALPSDFINRVAGAEGEQIGSVFGKIRPPGTFSFTTGTVQYFSIVTSFLLYGLVQNKSYPNWQLATAGIGLVLAVAVSGSRGAVASVGLVVVALLIVLFIRPRLITKLYRFFILAVMIGLSLSFVPSFNEGLNVLSTRIETSKAVEASSGGSVGRFFSDFVQPFNSIDQIPLLGYGLGMGTNAGASLLTGKVRFLLSEGEWGRVLMESGSTLGTIYIVLRIIIVTWMGWLCLKTAFLGNIMPFLLLGSCALLILNGQFGQPTTLGFAVFEGGLCLAACQNNARGF